MNKNTMAILVALSMVAVGFAFAPSATAVPCDVNHSNTASKSDCDEHAQIAGPGSLRVKGVVGVGVGFCHGLDPTLALACDNTGGVSGAGAHAHDTSVTGSDCTGAFGCTYHVWGQQSSGTGNGGFGLTVCTDRDDSGVCTNVGSNFDDFANSNVGPVLTGVTKDDKKGYVHVDFCVRTDIDNTYDDFWIFVYNWVSESLVFDDATGVGVSAGTYDIWIKKGDAHLTGGPGTACEHTGDP